jgi:hypothetical protein
MEHGMLAPFVAWESFYVIIGSSAAALTGLQFVVMVLGAEANLGSGSTTRAFGTPTVVHFCAVLLTSAVLSAPWHAVTSAAVCLALSGAGGLAYVFTIYGHMRKQTDYKPVFEDWMGHLVCPSLAYLGMVAGALGMRSYTETALFMIGAAALLLLFAGIHNAWDSVTYIAHARRESSG